MKKLILFLLLSSFGLAQREEAGVEVCLIAEVAEADGRLIPQRGARIYKAPDGSLHGMLIENGRERWLFGGGSEFTKTVGDAIANLPTDVRDWNAQIDAALARISDKTGRAMSTLDGWTVQIRIRTERGQIECVRSNLGSYLRYIGERDPKTAKLQSLLDVVSLAIGRQRLAL